MKEQTDQSSYCQYLFIASTKITIMREFQRIVIILPLFFISINLVYASSDSADNELTLLPSTENDYPNKGMKNINILFSNSYQSSTGSFYVNGAFENIGNTTLENVKVIGYFYDENNKMIGVTDCCYAEPDIVETGKTARFESFATENTMTGVPKYYKLSFEWDEPETDTIDTTVGEGSEVNCGNIIKSDVTLNSDLFCSGDGLIIQDVGDLTINLNNHTISGPGEKSQMVGLLIGNSDNIIINGPGTIKNFQAGVLNTDGDSNKVSRVTFTDNEIAFFDKDSKNTQIEDNLMFENSIGYSAHSSTNTKLTTNLFKSNDLAGVTLVNSAQNELSMNTIQGSVNGIFLDGQSTDNNVNSNNVLQNRGVDLNNGNGLSLEANDNTFSDNNCNTSVPDGLCLGKRN